jgi:assimilatory nitrate reductase catalytic subunit/cobaltochelatase CobN
MMAAIALEFLPLTLTLSPQAGRGDRKGTAYPFSPPAGRRWRQPDEGRKPVSAAARTPLWPAGHLPPKGGEWMRRARRLDRSAPRAEAFVLERVAGHDSISPLVGEMPGRAEGGEAAPLNAISQEAR